MRHLFSLASALRVGLWAAAILSGLAIFGCGRASAPGGEETQPSAVAVTINPGGPVVVRTESAEFDVLPSGYVQAYLAPQTRDGKRLTLDEPAAGSEAASDYLIRTH
jgi:hypothetical protein